MLGYVDSCGVWVWRHAETFRSATRNQKQQQPTTQTGTSRIALPQPLTTAKKQTLQTKNTKQTNLSKQKTKTTHCTLSQTFLTKKHKYKNKPPHNQTTDRNNQPMKRKTLTLTFALPLLFSLAVGLMPTESARADQDNFFNRQYLPELTIKSDGSIVVRQENWPHEESSAPNVIEQAGNVYTLTADIEGYAIEIECSNIIFDGAGHTIRVSPTFVNSHLRLLRCNNTTVKNLEVIGDTYTSISLKGSYCSITNIKTDALRIDSEGFNTITMSDLKSLTIWNGNNHISKCNIFNICVRSSQNVFTKNNFFFNSTVESMFIFNDYTNTYRLTANFWDNGSVGNYWSDYQSKYPNASEVDNTGIGNTPNVIDQDNIDHYPLMYPYDIEKNQIALPDRPPQADAESDPSTILIVGASIITIIGVITILLYYQKRQNSKANRLVASPFEGQEKGGCSVFSLSDLMGRRCFLTCYPWFHADGKSSCM
jgi:hypothetical protein